MQTVFTRQRVDRQADLVVGVEQDTTMRDDLLEPAKSSEFEAQADGSGSTYHSVAALAADLGLSERSTRSALRRGEIPHIRVGRRFVLPRAAIAEWLRRAGGTIEPEYAEPTVDEPKRVASSGHSEVTVMRPGKLAGR
jgi:excisionase family DNA binding protein